MAYDDTIGYAIHRSLILGYRIPTVTVMEN